MTTQDQQTREVADIGNAELAVMLGMDALRIAIGQSPMHFAPELVADGIRICAESLKE